MPCASTRRRRVSSRGRRIATIAGVALVAVLAGVLVAQSSGRRGSGGLTGLDVRAASSRITQCQELEQSGDPDGALACYSEVLDALPANVEALTSPWLAPGARVRGRGRPVRPRRRRAAALPVHRAVHVPGQRSLPQRRPPAVPWPTSPSSTATTPTSRRPAWPTSSPWPSWSRRWTPASTATSAAPCPAADVLQWLLDVLEVDEGNAGASIYLGWLIARRRRRRRARPATARRGARGADPGVAAAGFVFRASCSAAPAVTPREHVPTSRRSRPPMRHPRSGPRPTRSAARHRRRRGSAAGSPQRRLSPGRRYARSGGGR